MNTVYDPLFISRLHALFPDNIGEVVASFSYIRDPIVRVNTLVATEAQGVHFLESAGFSPKEILSDKNAYRLTARNKRDLTDSDPYKSGWFYIQSLSSMVPVWCIEREVRKRVESGDELSVLDMCAAPGSKTTQLAAVTHNSGKIIAMDSSRQRAYMLKANLVGQHVSNVTVQLGNAAHVWRQYGPVFDVVMLDAPCSGEGRFSDHDSSSFSDWSIKRINRLREEQKRLIFNAVMCLKSGGLLLYSTCTFAPEENEEVIDYVLSTFDGALEFESISIGDHRPSSFVDGVGAWEGKLLDSRIHHSVRIQPDQLWEGFFVCLLRRT